MRFSYSRGHKIEDPHGQGEWIWSDSKKPIDDNRPCAKCGKPPTLEGHDACLGCLPGIKAACCGHGISDPYCKPTLEESEER
jgi:hypothetical protein